MPIYEYSCPKCGTFEEHQKFSDPVLEVCPRCGAPVKKLISKSIGVIYKTGGYYVSDHRSSEYQRKAREDSSSASTDTKDTASKPAAE